MEMQLRLKIYTIQISLYQHYIILFYSLGVLINFTLLMF